MSTPGDPGRPQIMATGVQEILLKTVKAIGTVGAHSFELRYDITNRKARDDEEAQPGDAVRWTAAATWRSPLRGIGDREVTGTAVGEDHNHGHAIAYACTRLLEALGANVVFVDLASDQEPPR